MAEASVNGEFSQKEETPKHTVTTDVNKDLTKNVDENENTESAPDNTKKLENSTPTEETNIDTRSDMFDEKEVEKYELLEGKTYEYSISNGENVLNSTEKSNENNEQGPTSVQSKYDLSANGLSVEAASVPNATDTGQEHSKDQEVNSEPTNKIEEMTVKVSADSEIKCEKIEGQAGNQTTAVYSDYSKEEEVEEMLNKTEDGSKINAPSPEAVHEADEHTEKAPQHTDTAPSGEIKATPQEGTSTQEEASTQEGPLTVQEARNSVWYTDEAEREATTPKPEGYSTTVVGGVVVRKPLSSR